MAQEDHDLRVDYIEFSAPDLESVKRFYAGVFGWTFTDFGPDYTSFADGRLAGGFSKGEPATGRGPLVVIYALDLEGTKTAVVANGGAIVKEPFDFPGGRRFHFLDPSGYELAVWSDR